MLIAGPQKLTLLDYPRHVACTVFTHGCNLNCPFCHNPSLITGRCESNMDMDSLYQFLNERKGILDGICISGGEPLMQNDIIDFLRRVKGLGYKTKLDTNGCFPERLEEAIKGNLLDYIAMDVKSAKESYPLATGTKTDLAEICRSIEIIMNSGLDYEFRTTAVKGIHTATDFEKIACLIKGAKRYYIQQFENSGNIASKGLSAFSKAEMQGFLKAVIKYIPCAELRGL